MAIMDFSKQYHEEMFPVYTSKFLETDPKFIERFDNFAFDEVINMPDIGGKEVDGKIRHIAILAAQGGCEPQLISHSAVNGQGGSSTSSSTSQETPAIFRRKGFPAIGKMRQSRDR